jgi:shikimate dehydrogenase
MDITIRKAMENDYPELAKLYDELNTLHSEALPHIFMKPLKTPQDLANIRSILKSKDAVIFIAQSEEEIIGFAQAMIRQSPDHPVSVKRKYAYVNDICVMPKYRRLSVGKKLVEAVEK